MIRKASFIGLGKMGTPFSRHLLKAGFQVKGYDVVRERSLALQADGLVPADSPAEAARDADVVMMMLMKPEIITEVVFGRDGIAEASRPGTVVVDLSTMSPRFERELAAKLEAHGLHAIDAPVSGSVPHAEAADVLIMAGGEASSFERVRPALQSFAKNVVYMGDHGAGSAMKLVTQTVLFGIYGAVFEALVWGQRVGLEVGPMLDALKLGAANSRALELKDPLLRTHDFKGMVQATLELSTKDLGLIVEIAKELGVDVPHSALMLQNMRAALAQEGTEVDYAVLLRLLEARAGL